MRYCYSIFSLGRDIYELTRGRYVQRVSTFRSNTAVKGLDTFIVASLLAGGDHSQRRVMSDLASWMSRSSAGNVLLYVAF